MGESTGALVVKPSIGPLKGMRMREPFSGLSHLSGAALSLIGLIILLTMARGDAWRITSFAIYGASLLILYSASAVYHLVNVEPDILEWLRKSDHAGIFILIAGTYTPVCLVPLHGAWGWSLLGVVWAIAVAGVLLEIFWRAMPDWVDLTLYLLMGWLALIAIGPIAHAVSGAALHWLIAGGVLYTVGAAVYASRRPRLWPGVFGSHDLWHLFVLGGSAAHFMMILTFSVPPAR
ncbi:MAG TPA: hemolysin III family protein [Armatimonadota bacterium]|nr:hemolysin III family protein [Armatimonadota bacterium]